MMRVGRRTFTIGATLALLGVVGAGGTRNRFKSYHARPQVRSDLPRRDYVHGAPSAPALALSQTAALIRSADATPANAGGPGQVLKLVYYQLKQNKLQVEHCSISRAALALQSDG